uniref:hypothetical protein n=1 Tax=Methanobrevibacter sp. TaxID=66852 RepID=UPI003869A30C
MNAKLKKSFITLMIFLVLIVSISAISASDTDSIDEALSADVDLEQTLEISTDDGILSDDGDDAIIASDSSDENVIGDGEPGNFTTLKQLITDNDEITLDNSYRYNSNDNGLQTGIPITKNVTINGNGFTIDSTNEAQLFTVDANCKLILKDVTLLSDYVITSGATSKGNILNKGEIVFDNVTFTSKRISSGNAIAAAIFSDTTGKITIKNSAFVDSISNYTGTSTVMPYGLIFNKGILNIENSLFKNNGVYSAGRSMSTQNGLIYNSKTMTMENTSFENNFITYKGEGMSLINGILYGAASTTNLFNNCTFIENVVESHAATGSYLAYGTICIKGGAPVVTNSKFIKNSAWTGGAIAILPTTGSVTLISENNTFIENSANYDGSIALGGSGGAIYIHHNSILDSKNDKFIDNSAVYGGAIFGRTSNTNMANVTVTNAIFEGNTATVGPAIYRTNKTTANNNYWGTNNPDFEQLITDGTVSLTPENYVVVKIEGESSLSQGAVETYTVNFKTNDTDEIAALPEYTVDLTATNELSDDNVTIKDGSASFTYTANSAGDDAIVASANSQEKARFEVAVEGGQNIEGTFTELSNFIWDADDELDLARDYTFDANVDAGLENGIVINKTITINGNGFAISSTDLAKLFNVESTGNLILKDVVILTDFAATGTYANVRPESSIKNLGAVTFDNVTFTLNQNVNTTEKALAAGIYNAGTFAITNSKFVDSYIFTNTQSYCFGLIDNNGGTLNIENTVFSNNKVIENYTAGYVNGLIYNMGTLALTNVNVTNNTMETLSTTYGLIRGYTNSAITIDNSRFEDNTVTSAQNKAYGSAIYAAAGSMTITNSAFIKNAADTAGAIYSTIAATFINNTFEKNTATGPGGAIYSTGSNTKYIDNVFKENKAANGGALYSTVALQSGKAYNFTGNTFIDNEATTNGGALYVGTSIGSNNYPIESNVFINNKANKGGAIYSTGTLKITKAIFKGNEANEEGAAAYTTGSSASAITYSIFDNNVANMTTGHVLYYPGSSTANYNYWGTNDPDFNEIIGVSKNTLTVPTNIVLLTIDGPTTVSASEEYLILFTDNVTEDIVELPDYTVDVTSNINSIEPSSVVISEGIGYFNYVFENAGQDTITVLSDNNVKATLDINEITEVSVSLTAEDINMTYKDGSAWVVTLTDADGNPIAGAAIKVGIYGKLYNRKTDDDGVARLVVNLAPGSYAVNATFEGDDIYESAFVNGTVTVNKAASVLSGDNIVMSYKDGNGWIVTLTDANNSPIAGAAIKVGIYGKLYNRKTDDDGNACLVVNLAPGSYAVNATFAGNRYYESAFVEATVTVNKANVNITGQDLVMTYQNGSYAVSVVDAQGNPLANVVVKF